MLGPLCVFLPLLAKTKREGLLIYGALASRYVREFDNKWLHGGAAQDEAFLGSGDIQSLVDLTNSVEVIHTMQLFPFGKQTIIQTAVFALLSFTRPLVNNDFSGRFGEAVDWDSVVTYVQCFLSLKSNIRLFKIFLH